MTEFFQDGLLPAVAVFHPQQEDGHTDDPQQDHSPKRESQGGTAQGAGYQQAPGTSEHNDHQKTGGGDGGEPGQNAQQVIGKEGQEKGQDEESVCFGPDDGEVLVGNGPAHQAVRKRLAQRACQEKDQQGGGEDRGDGKKKGGPGAEEHPAGGGAEVAGDGGQHHRQELEQEKTEVGVGSELRDIVLKGLLGGEGGEEAAAPQKDAAQGAQEQDQDRAGDFQEMFHEGPRSSL